MKKTIKKLLGAVLALSFVPMFSVPAAFGAETEAVFEDIEGHWAQEDIEYLYNAGLVSGVSETEFAPDATVDKAQFITMLTRAMGLEPDIYSISYSDVAPLDDWFAGYLGAAVNAGIIENSVFAFYPDEKIQRGGVAEMLYKALDYEGLTDDIPQKDISYSDISPDSKLSEAVTAVASIGVMVGETETEFDPDSTLTRAQAAAVVKRLSLAASTIGEMQIPLNISEAQSAAADGEVVTFNGDYSYIAIDNVEFHYGINTFKVQASSPLEGMQLELWIDAMDAVDGAKLGTIEPEAGGAEFKEYKISINRTYGSHRIYIRLIGGATVSVKDITLAAEEYELPLKNYSTKANMDVRSSTIYNIKDGGYINYNARSFGDGFNTIEFTMNNSVDGQLFEIFLDDEKTAVVETASSGEEGVTFQTPISKAEDTKNLSIRAITDVDGTITNIRFLNVPPKADLILSADTADSTPGLTESNDYGGGMETSAMQDGDIIKFSNVNMSDGYNVLAMRIKNDGFMESALSMATDGEETGYIMGLFSGGDEDAYIEVRLDRENGPLVGTIKQNPIPCSSEYDIQTGYIYGANGLHDLYLKAVGDIGWKVRYVKLQERGWYDMPMTTLQAEDMTLYMAEATNPNDTSRYAPHSITSEAMGKSAVKIEENGGYVEFTVPEWYESGGENTTAITVRHSIPDYIDENNYSVGQDGTMRVTVNGNEAGLLDSFNEFKDKGVLTLSSKCTRGYGDKWGNGTQNLVKNEYSGFFFNDAYAIIEGDIKAGDVIRLIPEINESVNYCYIDSVDIETIPEAKTKPERFLSITECGAVANDGEDDGEALRQAVQMVKDDPYTYNGIWIPEGLFDIRSYVGDRSATAADFTGIRVLGAGLWHSQLLAHLGTWTQWCANYNTGNNTVIRDVALHGTTIARGWEQDGKTLGAIALSGSGAHFIENVWFEHWNANAWLSDASGVLTKNRVKNSWADGYNSHNNTYGMIYTKNYLRSTGDDALAIFSACDKSVTMARNIQITNNTVDCTYWATGITIWGGEDIDIANNMVRDTALHCGIALSSWGYESPATDNVWIRNNRIERCGNVNEGNQDNAAFGMTPAKPLYTYGEYNTVYKNTYFENNEAVDNPSVFMRISSQDGANEVFMNVRYNYIRNTCLSFPDRQRIIDYRTAAVKGENIFAYNVFEGAYTKFKTSNTQSMTDVLIGNVPNNWE